MASSPAVLITGCSSGIGRATAVRLAGTDWTVYATARRLESMAGLEEAGCSLLELDVTDEESLQRAVAEVEGAAGAIGALVNNAGYSLSGAVESVPLDEARRQFETNVFGLARLTQLVLPAMRRQGRGRIVNVSSMGGKLTFPGGGWYHASKHAVEALSDAFRFELQGFGIDVVVVEPGLIRTGFAEAAVGIHPGRRRAVRDLQRGRRRRHGRRVRGWVRPAARRHARRRRRHDRAGGDRETAPDAVPRDASAKLFLTLRKVLPDRGWDALVSRTYPQPRP